MFARRIVVPGPLDVGRRLFNLVGADGIGAAVADRRAAVLHTPKRVDNPLQDAILPHKV